VGFAEIFSPRCPNTSLLLLFFVSGLEEESFTGSLRSPSGSEVIALLYELASLVVSTNSATMAAPDLATRRMELNLQNENGEKDEDDTDFQGIPLHNRNEEVECSCFSSCECKKVVFCAGRKLGRKSWRKRASVEHAVQAV